MTYASSLPGRIGALIGGLLLTVVLCVAIPKLLVEGALGVRSQPVLVGCLLLILAAGLVITVMRVFVTGPIVIHTTPMQVELRRGGRIRETWSRAETQFSSFIVRQSTNGIHTGTTRKLIVTTAGERLEIVLPWFTKKTFNALIADVAPLVPAATSPAAAAAAAYAAPVISSGTFTIDHSPVRRGRRIALVLIVVALLAVAVTLVIPGIDASDQSIVLFLVGSAAVLVIVVAAVLALRGRRIPLQLSVTPSALQFDDRTFSIAQLTSIVATPATYQNAGGRAISLVDTAGRRTVIGLGTFGNRTFPDYDRYLETIRGATAHRPGLFSLDVA